MTHIAFLGGGNMARAIAQGLLAQSDWLASVADPNLETHEFWRSHFNAQASMQADDSWRSANVIVLAVKPQQWREAAAQLAPFVAPDAVVISVMAGIPLASLSGLLGNHGAVVRTMPNTPARVQQGITGAFAATAVSEAQKKLANAVLKSVGEIVWLSAESQLDAVTAISGSGPAYVFYLLRSLAQAGVNLGLPPEQATQLALATFSGATYLAAQSGEDLALLQAQVTSKGGTTAAALAVFDAANLSDIIAQGAKAANDRASELAKEFS